MPDDAKSLGDGVSSEALRRLHARAHLHSDFCYGRYQPCGEHHMHDDTCGSRPLICGQREDRDLLALLIDFARHRAALDETLSMLERGKIYTTIERVAELRKMLKFEPEPTKEPVR